jgi:acetyltransferase-like isoleucine patch superfamily enzyme
MRQVLRRLARLLSPAPPLPPGVEGGVQIKGAERVTMGYGCQVQFGTVLHGGGMAWSDGQGYIRLGDRVFIGPHCTLFGAGGIEIGDDALLSPHVVITSHQHTFAATDRPIRDQPAKFAPVVIEPDVWIGAGAVVLPGVRIGRGAVVGAGAVVTRDVSTGAIVMGVPARVVRYRGDSGSR